MQFIMYFVLLLVLKLTFLFCLGDIIDLTKDDDDDDNDLIEHVSLLAKRRRN